VLSEQHRRLLAAAIFAAAVPPRFAISLVIEIRAKKTGELEVRHGGRTFFASNVSPVTASGTTLLLSVIRGVAALFTGCKRSPQKSRSL